MGTECAIVVASRRQAFEGEAWIHDLASRFTRFSSDSELSRLNARAGGWIDISAELEAVLRAAMRAFEMSGGLVNAAVLPSMLASGYIRPLAGGPGRAVLERAQPTPALVDVMQLRQGRARLERGAGIDVGGIAKGWMADRLCEILAAECVVNLGGDLRVVGRWPVGFRGTTLMLRDQAAATSSVRKRKWAGGHHLIDPRTGAPCATGLEEVSVVTPTAFEAEVVAKTALLLGPELATAYCASHALAWWVGGPDDA